ncbi:methionyl-tRNA formyltransferase [Patescibacteria group bacterium]|nr:methionyl-tRNA formyltransferase [Patescibacteria group bacterium]MCL5091535.1 methionyl-tRNA formyltransferase [Patescibacteria group bacterium]
MQKLKLAYFGSPDFSARLLEKIINDHRLPVAVALVVTQPDRPAGRNQTLTPTPVKTVADQYHIKIVDFSLGNAQVNRTLDGTVEQQNLWRFLKTLDLALVYAYGEILPEEMLNLPKYGFWNIHPSLLPEYRGASPIAYPLILGDKASGVSLIQMDKKMDHGSILAQERLEIKPDDARPDLEKKLTNLAWCMFKKLISTDFSQFQTISTRPQDHSRATYTVILKKSDGFIPLTVLKKCLNNQPLDVDKLPNFLQHYLKQSKIDSNPLTRNSQTLLFNLFHGLSPWPGLWTNVTPTRWNGKRQKRLKVIEMKIVGNTPVITKVQLEGKNPVDLTTFNRAYPGLL